MIVAIDGPAGTGKGTVSKLIAHRLDFTYIDTGAMYRAVTLKMMRNNIEITELDKIQEMLDSTSIEFKNATDENGDYKQIVLLDDEDVSDEIRTPKVNEKVSAYSYEPIIRAHLRKMQRDYANSRDIIMEGRDITTVVFPDADIKIFLTASPEERAMRRYKEFISKGIETTYEETLDAINKRDESDRANPNGLLRIVDDAIVLDTTNLGIEEVYEEVKKLIDKR